jgi:leucyl-tRNA synthetase
MRYEHQEVERKWREIWESRGDHVVDLLSAPKPYYNLMMFPYPSAEGLHVGNVYAFTGADIHGRFRRMQGYDLFEPIGFDAFGIHSENFAIQRGVHPAVLTAANVENFRENQLKRIGARYDWSKQVNTSLPSYYGWTQWVFLRLFEQGLAYQKSAPVNWCPSCMTVLADEQVEHGECERCSSEVEQRTLKQWFLRITDYAQRLLEGLDVIDWSEVTRTAQRNWIGRSEGALLRFPVEGEEEPLEVFTTRPDTVFGATYMVLAPEHPLVDRLTTADQKAGVEAYRKETRRVSQEERIAADRPKTGVATGAYAENPATGARIPMWIADYVLMGYGTGAIMAVPAHDERDFAFAKEYGLPIIEVISPDGSEHDLAEAYTEAGQMVHSGQFDGVPSTEGKSAVTKWLGERGLGELTVNYRLRDWCLSRQRYWGPPIPIIHCPDCGSVAVPDKDLPVVLPDLEDTRPDDTGRPPLARLEEWVSTTCPKCGGPARRDTDVSDNFLCSAWYFIRYPSADRTDIPWDRELTEKWLPVDMYIGGNEHACLHLMYTRFLVMALSDAGLIPFTEPFKKFRAHGLLTKDGAKMSKSKGNVVNPDEFLDRVGADTLRLYLMFCGPFQQGGDWRDAGIAGMRRFIERVYQYVTEGGVTEAEPSAEVLRACHAATKKVGDDLAELRYNTAIAAIMELTNSIRDAEEHSRYALEVQLKLLAPFAPFVTEELWSLLGHPTSIHNGPWPTYDPALLVQDVLEIPVQVNGKLRGTVNLPVGAPEADAVAAARELHAVQVQLGEKPIRKVIYLQDKLLNVIA